MDFVNILSIFGVVSLVDFLLKIAISAVIYLAFHFLSGVLVKYLPKLFVKIFRRDDATAQDAFVNVFAKPLSLIVKAVGIFLAVTNLPLNSVLSVSVYAAALKILRIAIIILVSSAVQNFVMNIPVLFTSISEKFGGVNMTLIPFFTKLGKALGIVFTVVIVVDEFGYDVTSLITGLGLGGLTFALAAQDIASNFMAGITILTDKPFAVGDWISVGGMEGIVEEMNFRSTRIRTFDNALITVPNSKLSNDSVTNWTKMQYRKTNIIIGLLYSTTRETLQAVINDIYSELSAFEEIKTDSLLVKFDNFSASSLDVKISYNSFPIPAPAHMALKEKVQLKIMEVVEKHETDFAYNTLTIINEN